MKSQKSASKQAKAVDNRPVTILSRYFVKAGEGRGRICLTVMNGESKKYNVTLYPNGATSCECKAGVQGTRCYHVRACLKREIERGICDFFAALNEFCQIENYLSEQEYQDMGYLIDAPKPGKLQCPWQKQYASDPREKMLSAPLNGNREFSLLKR